MHKLRQFWDGASSVSRFWLTDSLIMWSSTMHHLEYLNIYFVFLHVYIIWSYQETKNNYRFFMLLAWLYRSKYQLYCFIYPEVLNWYHMYRSDSHYLKPYSIKSAGMCHSFKKLESLTQYAAS